MSRFSSSGRNADGARHEDDRGDVNSTGGGIFGEGVGRFDWETEVEMWRDRFAAAPYGRGRTFEEFRPAFLYALRAYSAAPGTEFEDVEAALEDGWHWNREDSSLPWPEARQAAMDAWRRALHAGLHRASLFERSPAARLNSLIRVLHDRRLGFQQAALEVESDRIRSVCVECSGQSRGYAEELAAFVKACGERPAGCGTVLGSLGRGWSALRRASGAGDRAVLGACVQGEAETLAAYASASLCMNLAPEHRTALAGQRRRLQIVHEALRSWRDSL